MTMFVQSKQHGWCTYCDRGCAVAIPTREMIDDEPTPGICDRCAGEALQRLAIAEITSPASQRKPLFNDLKGIHCGRRTGGTWICGLAIPPKVPGPNMLIDDFRAAIRLQTMRALLCPDCVDVVTASERQI